MSRKLHQNGSFRLDHYDYGRNGFYFVTICIQNKGDYFGKIINGEMQYSKLGNIARHYWQQIPEHFPFVILDEWVIMPDHMHGIVVIDKLLADEQKDVFVGACHGMRPQGNIFSKPKSGSLWTIINHFKGSVTRWANNNNIPFAWQSRYHDHIIRNERALHTIRRYIRNNPRMWHN